MVAVVDSRIVASTGSTHSRPIQLEGASRPKAKDIASHASVKSVEDECCGEVPRESRAVELQPSSDSSNAVFGVDVCVHRYRICGVANCAGREGRNVEQRAMEHQMDLKNARALISQNSFLSKAHFDAQFKMTVRWARVPTLLEYHILAINQQGTQGPPVQPSPSNTDNNPGTPPGSTHSHPIQLEEASRPKAKDIASHDCVMSVEDELCGEVPRELCTVELQPSSNSSNAVVCRC
jgi:hypothetical protein